MSTNPYFQSGVPGGRGSEQRLLEDLIIESLKIYGFDALYIPRKLVNEDQLFGEDSLSKFEYAIPLEMYLKDVQGFGNTGELVAKYGLKITDTCTFVVARSRWDEVIARRNISILDNRPSEGDLIYLPLSNSLFEIKFVEHENPFYQLGRLYVYEMQCELFVYSSERLNTGINEVDEIVALHSQSMDESVLYTQTGHVLTTESGAPLEFEEFIIDNIIVGADNEAIRVEGEDVLDFSEGNPFGEVRQ